MQYIGIGQYETKKTLFSLDLVIFQSVFFTSTTLGTALFCFSKKRVYFINLWNFTKLYFSEPLQKVF